MAIGILIILYCFGFRASYFELTCMRQKLGQHFLKDEKVLERITELVQAGNFETLIEIGPGHGELTKRLITYNPQLKTSSSQLKIIAIERDKKLAEELRQKFVEEKNIYIIEGNALETLPEVAENTKGKYAVIGNIPYYITGFLLRTLGALPKKPEIIILLIQKEVADRLLATKGEMNRLAASVQFWGKPEMILIVPPGAFSPPPKVHSAVIAITPEKKTSPISEEKYYKTVRLLFSQPRKTVLNNVSEELSKEKGLVLLEKAGIDPQNRPQDLSVSEIITLANVIFPE